MSESEQAALVSAARAAWPRIQQQIKNPIDSEVAFIAGVYTGMEIAISHASAQIQRIEAKADEGEREVLARGGHARPVF